jgi:Uma2 family endonuclease
MSGTTRMTLGEFLNMRDDEKPALEFACGQVTQKPMPNRLHATLQLFVGSTILQFLKATGLGTALTEFRCIFGPLGRERVFVPDVVYVVKERLTADLYLHAPPDLAIEIISPGQDMARLFDKIQFYLLNGVRLVWVIDPDAETIAVLAPGQEGRTLTAGDILDGGDVLPGFSVAVDEIFAQTKL